MALAKSQEPCPRAIKPDGGRGCVFRGSWALIGFVGDGVGRSSAWMNVQAAAFFAVQGTRTAPAKDGNLVARLVNGAVAVNPF
jgi:hypothetical protein